VGRWTRDTKLINIYEELTDESTSTEFSNLEDNPHETGNLYNEGQEEQVGTFERAVDEFVDRDGISEGLQCGTPWGPGETRGKRRSWRSN
jgi:hypothetical protein